jgi:hypothetical protein
MPTPLTADFLWRANSRHDDTERRGRVAPVAVAARSRLGRLVTGIVVSNPA